MEIDLPTKNQIVKATIKILEPSLVKEMYRSMQMPEQLNNIKTKTFAAYIDKELIGMLNLQLLESSNAHIDLIFVSEPLYFQTIVTKLLLAAENDCYEQDYSSLTLETSDNNPLYGKLGYKPLFEAHNSQSRLVNYKFKSLSLNDFTFIDLTHSLSGDVPHWGIDQGFKYNARLVGSSDDSSGVKFRIQRLEMTAGIGTHMDAPSHCFEHAASISDIPLQSLITVCRVIDISERANDTYTLSTDDIQQFENEYGIIPKNSFVIIYTGWDTRWNEAEKYRNEKIFPSISPEAAEVLLSRDIVGLGIDTLSPDAFGSDFPVHQLILGAGKYIIENVANAKLLHPAGSYVIALPIKVVDGTEAPIRLVGLKRKE